jgi:hypothetical protein
MIKGAKKKMMYATVIAVTILNRRMFASSILCEPLKLKDSLWAARCDLKDFFRIQFLYFSAAL